MKLMTRQLEKRFQKFPLYSQDGKGEDAIVIVKYFNPYGAGTWLITEGESEGSDWRFFGYGNINGDWEWGYVMLSELQSVRPLGIPGIGIERDLYMEEGAKVKDLI